GYERRWCTSQTMAPAQYARTRGASAHQQGVQLRIGVPRALHNVEQKDVLAEINSVAGIQKNVSPMFR
ncbi:MAG: hypothetical protein M3214_13440, partial [Actinomycetota bacterium]|nr:hypothetical protein [Actinomycetota bacterium]